MSQFNEEHQKAFGTDAPVGGHPDEGNGYYAQRLSYADWYVFNNWQRTHLNFLETISPVACMTLITSINAPKMASICIWILVAGRIFYTIGYCKNGPKGRVFGAIVTDIGLLAVLVGGFYSIFSWNDDYNRILPISEAKFDSLSVTA